jgi:hypothetical protein
MITRVSSVIRPEGSDLIFDHPYNAESALENRQVQAARATPISAIPVRSPAQLGKGVGRRTRR